MERIYRLAASSVALIFLLTLFSVQLQAGGVTAVSGKVTGQVICLYSWKTDMARGEAYQGGHATCPNADHDRSLISEKGKIYILEPADDASKEVIDLVRTDKFERKNVIVEGDVVPIDKNVDLIKVKSFKMK